MKGKIVGFAAIILFITIPIVFFLQKTTEVSAPYNETEENDARLQSEQHRLQEHYKEKAEYYLKNCVVDSDSTIWLITDTDTVNLTELEKEINRKKLEFLSSVSK